MGVSCGGLKSKVAWHDLINNFALGTHARQSLASILETFQPMTQNPPVSTRWEIKEVRGSSERTIKDSSDNEIFKTRSRFRDMATLSIVNLRNGRTAAEMKEKMGSGYDVYTDGVFLGNIKEKRNFFSMSFRIELPNSPEAIIVKKDNRSYEFSSGNKVIAEMRKHPDTCTVNIHPRQDVIFILACCVTIGMYHEGARRKQSRESSSKSTTFYSDSTTSHSDSYSCPWNSDSGFMCDTDSGFSYCSDSGAGGSSDSGASCSSDSGGGCSSDSGAGGSD
ncbi:hypothetical protein Ddc_14567 [Ditylenchus destructor]|nr:hypothetical protein Ddc_14567 [Ditylenchus destructor]